MEDKITIIEGPPPTFEVVQEGWVQGLNEGPNLADIAITRLRTFNGPALVERCHRAWRKGQNIHLEFRTEDGTEHEAPIVAARTVEMEEGQILLLWVRINDDEVELELGYEVDDSSEEDGEVDELDIDLLGSDADEDYESDEVDDEDDNLPYLGLS